MKDRSSSEGRHDDEFESLALTSPDIVYRIDAEGRFTYLNPAIRSLGYRPEELIGKHFSEIVVPADLETASSKHVLPKYCGKATGDESAPKLIDERRGPARKTAGLNVRLVPKSAGRTRPGVMEALSHDSIIAEVSSSGIYKVDPNAKVKAYIGTVGIIRDVTKQRWMEAELRKYTDRLEPIPFT